jgi:peptidoglycan hydrolase-like protein with peptidoglycan-binding domain
MIAGCGSGTTGFSTVSGQSCATNGTTITTSTSYNLGTVTLKNGSKGESVKQLQKLLNKLLNMSLKEDGILGPKTIAVIKKWQKDHGLVADGLVGPKTKAAMQAEVEK